MTLRMAVIFSLLLLCPAVFAQRGRGFITIEAHVGIAHSVNVGRIDSIEPSDYTFPPEDQYYGKPYKITFSVTETIKGPKAKSLSFDLALQHTTEINYLKENNIELVLFHSDVFSDEEGEFGPGTPGNFYSFRILEKLESAGNGSLPRTTADQLNINLNEGRFFDLNLNVISGRDNILRKARAFAKKYPGTLKVNHLMVPNSFASQCGYPNAFAILLLPICNETKKVIAKEAKNFNQLLKFTPESARKQQKTFFSAELSKFLALFDEEADSSANRGQVKRPTLSGLLI